MIVHRADWVLPVAGPPIRDGWVAVEDGLIAAVGGSGSAPPPGAMTAARPFGRAVILPGLVNAHTHLEISWMEGKVPPAPSMPEWVSRLISLRATVSHEPPGPIAEAVRFVRSCGTALVGDITNTLDSYPALLDSELSACVFHEVLGFNARDPQKVAAEAAARLDALTPVSWIRCGVVPHAPYSVSPELLRAVAAVSADRVVSVHVAESPAEIEFLRDGTGPWRTLLEQVDAWNPAWTPPRCGPVEYLEGAGLVTSRLLAVHCVQATAADLRLLADAGATVVTCPRSNRWTGAGVPPIAEFYRSGVRVAVGTDSLASVDDLNVFGELKALRALAPSVAASRLLDSATRQGAEALGFGAELGTIEPGKRAELIAVRIRPGIQDVEEYLLGGIEPADIAWLDPGFAHEPEEPREP